MGKIAQKTRERYRRELEAIKPFVKRDAFPSPQKAEYKDVRRLRRYLSHVGEATSQPYYVYQAKSDDVRKAIRREFKPPRLSGLKGQIVPVQNWGDRAKIRLRGGELEYRVESEIGTLGRRFVRFPLKAIRELDGDALEAWMRAELRKNQDANALFFQFGGKDSQFTRDPAETVAEEDAVAYVRKLVEDERYTEHEKWMDGAVFLRALGDASSARIPRRAGAGKRLDESTRQQRLQERQRERVAVKLAKRATATKKAARKKGRKRRAKK